MKDIHICMATDETYVPYCGVTVLSAIKNKEADEILHFHILNQGISETSAKKLKSIASENDHLDLIDVQNHPLTRVLNNMPITQGTHLTAETYFRMLIPDIFSDLDRIVYLDCDIVIRGSLAELFNMDMRGKLLAMAKAYGYTGKRWNHYNAGVMVINCNQWRKEKITEFLIDFADRTDEEIGHDQDLINFALMDEIYELNYKWNRQILLDETDGFYSNEDDKIRHFLTYAKPWHGVYNNVLVDEYYSYLKELPWDIKDNRERNRSIDVHKYYQYMINLRWLLADAVIHIETNLVVIETLEELPEYEYAALELNFSQVKRKKLSMINDEEENTYFLLDGYYDAKVRKVLEERGYHIGEDYSFLRYIEHGQIEKGLKERLKAKKIKGLQAAIYGTGEWAHKCTAVLAQNGADIPFYIDSNREKEGQCFCDKDVISPLKVVEHDEEIDIIVLASSFHNEMKKNLLALGIETEKIIEFDFMEPAQRKIRMKLAPIILFTYKRLKETQQTIEALRKCPEANNSELYIFSDGAKGEHDAEKVSNVRKYLRKISGFKKVEIVESEKNKGLAISVIEGVTKMISQYEAIIVLEDDLIVSNEFLSFMNRALAFYKQDKRIWSITGHSEPINLDIEEDVYLSPRFSAWGWAIWRDRLQLVDWNVSDYEQFVSDREMKGKFSEIGSDAIGMLRMEHEGVLDTWDIQMVYNQFKHGMMTLHPTETLVVNTGFSDDATHTKQIPCGYEKQNMCKRWLELSEVDPSEETFEKLREFYNRRSAFDIPQKYDIKRHDRLIIYGAAANGERTYLLLDDLGYNVLGFSDSDKRKWGSYLYGLEIIPPIQIQEKEFDYILVASSAFKAIRRLLLDMGIKDEKIITFEYM